MAASHITLYRSLMMKLTTEREGMSDVKKKQKQEKIYQLTKGLCSIEGDEKLAARVDAYFKEIAAVKPGRKLIKALAKTKTQHLLKIKQGDRFECGQDSNNLLPLARMIKVKECTWRVHHSVDKNGESCAMKSPAWISFAHELIHALHCFSDPVSYFDYLDLKSDLLPHMHNLEEQRTITGWNPFLFTKAIAVKNESGFSLESIVSFFFPQATAVKTIDVLCENAFNMAIGLPVRIDHRRVVDSEVALAEAPHSYDSYYSWLEKAIKGSAEDECILTAG